MRLKEDKKEKNKSDIKARDCVLQSLAFCFFVDVRKVMQNECRQKTNEESADATAKEQIGQIVQKTVSENQNGDQNLTKVMCQTTADADTCRAEDAEVSGELHYK